MGKRLDTAFFKTDQLARAPYAFSDWHLALVQPSARFEDPLDFGYTTQNIQSILQEDLDTYGQFNVYFAPRNLRALLWAPPELDGEGELPGFWPNRQGMSIFLTTPVFLFLLWRGRNSWLYYGALVSLALILVRRC